ncbi:MAG: polysaccharide deacetylase family protein [Bacteroidales bacterium]|nr:polysaccharide deacetylase family protein [Bacteroidales bacterium]
MKKILILSYFFPPSNFAGSYRVASFAKYFHKYGYYPIVITRQAPNNAGTFREMAGSCGTDIIFEKHDGYEVYYLPYKANLRDRIYSRYGDNKLVWLRKMLSFFELIFQGITVKAIPYANIYFFAKDFLKKNKDIDFLLCSGKPYQLFLFAHLLNKKFKIKWIADYRDEWNSLFSNNNIKLNFKERFFLNFDSQLEKKWTKSASLITTVTEEWAKNLSNFLNKPCKVVLNGFDFEIIDSFRSAHKTSSDKESLVILHLGSLYDYQPIEIFIEAVINLLRKNFKISCFFPGITNSFNNEKRLQDLTNDFSDSFVLMPRIDQKKVYHLMAKADIFIMIGYQDIKGWMSSKILEYLPWHKPIILCPSDNGILEHLIKPYSKSFVCNTSEEVEKNIISIYNNKKQLCDFNADDEIYCKNFTREKQVEILSNYLNKISFQMNENIKVLCFHRVSDEYSPAYPPIPIKTFEKILIYLKKRYEIIGFDDIQKSTKKPKIIITFDDGYKDFYTNVFPLLKKYQIRAILCIVPSLVESGICPWSQILNKSIEAAYNKKLLFEIPEIGINKKRLTKTNIERFAVKVYYLLSSLEPEITNDIIKKLHIRYEPELTKMTSWDELKTLVQSGLVELASHSMTHCNLTKSPNNEFLINEIQYSKEIINKKLSINVRNFTPPGGFIDKQTEDLIIKNNYKYILNVDNLIWNTKNMNVSRILMPYTVYWKNILMIKLIIPRIKSFIKFS